jgi:integration host factor subunit beta
VNRSRLVERVSKECGLSEAQAETIVDIIYDSIAETLREGGRVEIRGFGSFVVREYPGRQGRNPKTGERIEVPPKKLPFFKVGKEMRERVDVTTSKSPHDS